MNHFALLPFIAQRMGVLTLALTPLALYAADPVAAWVKPGRADGVVPANAFQLERAGKNLSYPAQGLMACDKLRLTDDRAVVEVILSNNQRLVLDKDTLNKTVQVPCDQPGFFASMLALAKSIAAQSSTTPMTAKGTLSRSGPLTVPALGAYAPHLAAGARSLYIAWAGGAAPYKVQLLRADGTTLAQANAVKGLSVRLPKIVLAPGLHTLRVVGNDGKGIEDTELTVVSRDKLPNAPPDLAAAGLQAADFELLYAYFLEGFDDGRWTLEAVQRVAAMNNRSPNAEAWLRRFGGHLRD